MATRKMKLPSLKVKLRPTQGSTIERVIPRGVFPHSNTCAQTVPPEALPVDFSTDGEKDVGCLIDHMSEPFEPSLHKIAQESSIAGWNRIRHDLLNMVIESSAMPENQQCCLCNKEATHRCQSCSASNFFCYECFSELHKNRNFFHTGEVWEVRNMLELLVVQLIILVKLKLSMLH